MRLLKDVPATLPNVGPPLNSESILGWKAQYDLDKMCQDAWNWQSKILMASLYDVSA